MPIFECSFCKKPDDSIDANGYRACELADGKPCLPCAQALDLDNLITQARVNLDRLLFQKRDLHTKINRSHERIIHRLPPEVSTSIFLFSLSEDSSFISKSLDNPKEGTVTTPLILGAVCQAWRNIAWTSPYLWTDISIPVKPRHELTAVNVAHEWILRAGQLPLSLRVYAPRITFGETLHANTVRIHLAKLMGLYLSRCRRLEFACPSYLIPSFSGEAPILEELKITSTEDIPRFSPIILRAMRSEGVRISITGYRYASLDIAWESITSFEGSFHAQDCLQILQNAPRLLEFHLLGLPEAATFLVLGNVVHHSLTTLTLDSKTNPSSPLLNNLTLPALKHLKASHLPPSDLLSLIQRSLCNLYSICMNNLRCADGELVDMLRATPCLHELHLMADNVFDYHAGTFFTHLGRTSVPRESTREDFLSNLHVLGIRFSFEAGFPWELVADLFGSLADIQHPRRRPITDLQVTYDWRIGYVGQLFELEVDVATEYSSNYLNEEVTRRFLKIAQAGVHLDFYDVHEKVDILGLAMAYHDIDIPAWYRTKMHNVNDLDSEYGSDDMSAESSAYSRTEGSDPGNVDDVDNDSDTDMSDRSYESHCGLPDSVTGETSQMLFNYVEIESENDSEG